MANKAFFLLRLNDHIRYLNNMDGALAGRSDFKGCLHTECKLGVWLHGEGRSEAEACGPEAVGLFESLFEPHEAFHQAGAQALQFKAEGKNESAEQAVTEMHLLSVKLVNALVALDKASTAPPGAGA